MSTPESRATCAAFYAAQHCDTRPLATAARGAAAGATAMDLCTRSVVTCDAGMQVGEAARLMRSHHVGALVVVENHPAGLRLVTGIVTDRDIATGIVAADRDSRAARVADIMSGDVITARGADGVPNLLAVMHRERVRRLPVTGPEGELIGIVTIDDLLGALAAQVQALAQAVGAAQRRIG